MPLRVRCAQLVPFAPPGTLPGGVQFAVQGWPQAAMTGQAESGKGGGLLQKLLVRNRAPPPFRVALHAQDAAVVLVHAAPASLARLTSPPPPPLPTPVASNTLQPWAAAATTVPWNNGS